jgi:hypothetical protein
MGFETQEEAERWAEEIEFRADAAREEKLLASAETELRASVAWTKFIAENPEFITGTQYLIELARSAYLRGYKDATK